jgi:hypothetical protein
MSTPSLFDQATQALKAGDTLQARNLLTQLVKTDPQNAQAWLMLSACWNEPEKKRYCLEKASSLQPDDPQIRQALSELAAGSGEHAAAIPTFEQNGLPPVELAAVAAADTPAEGTPPLKTAPDEAAPAGQPTAGQKTKAKRPAVARKKKTNWLAQAGMLVLLLIVALAAVAILFVVLQQNGIDLISLAQPAPSSPAQLPAAVPTFAMPATWTPTSAPISVESAGQPSATLFRPSATLPLTPTPVPSITPFYAVWRIVIGQSVQDRPIEVYRFGAGKHERLIVAGIHGGSEANTIALADQLIEYLQKNPERVPVDVSLYILRSLNPDGEALGDKPEARFNANGVDLNRNFDQNWKASWKGGDCVSTDPKTAGTAAASEPETQAFMKFLMGRKIEALIDYHSAKLGIFPAGQPASPASVKLAEAIAAASPYAYPPVKTNCEFTGTLVDWAISQGTQAAVDLELNSSSDPEFATNLKILDLLLTWQP